MTSPMLPTFLVIGAMKSGTSSLHAYLSAQTDVYMPATKEIEFFSEPQVWSRGIDWYSSLFAAGADVPARGEASTGYTRYPRYPEAAGRIGEMLPGARLVYLVREPIDRMMSHYRHSVLTGREKRGVDEALLADEGLLETSRYAAQLRRHLDHHEREQVLVLFSEDLEGDRRSTVNEVLRFIGAGPVEDDATLSERTHVSSSRVAAPSSVRRLAASSLGRRVARLGVARDIKGRLGRRPDAVDDEPSDVTRARLSELLADDVAELRRIVGRVPDSWQGYV